MAYEKVPPSHWRFHSRVERQCRHTFWHLRDPFGDRHGVIKHTDGIYAMGDIYTNTAESFFALFKRGVHGIFHHVGRRHLRRYCDEFSFRWDHRKVTDGTRMVAAIVGAEGKRLQYR